MPKKKKIAKSERREQRLRKAKQWALNYEGSHIVRAYRKRFHLDVSCALLDLESIGVLSPEQLTAMRASEEARLRQKREERNKKREQAFFERFPNSDDTFFYIVGYTPGGAPYGTTWEEIGLKPYESLYDEETEEADGTNPF